MNMIDKMPSGSAERRRAGDRRKQDRHDVQGAQVSIDHAAGPGRALCGDVSRGGARLSLDRAMAVGDAVTIRFGADVRLAGRVTWIDGGECGIAFEGMVGGLAQGNAAAAIRGDRRRAVVRELIAGSRFREGLNVMVILPDGEKQAVLRWSADHRANITVRP